MASIKILHTADLHFDSAFSALPKDKANARKTHLFETFDKMISLAKEEAVDAFLIAGDLFDGESVSSVTVRAVFEKLGTLAPIPVFLSAGNHDPFDKKSVYATWKLPENIHVFSPERMEKIELKPGVSIYGRSFSGRFEQDLFENFRAEDGLSIMVLHGDVGGGEDYNPIQKRAVLESGLSYLALGHIHTRSEVERLGSTFYAYPGAPEGRGFDECGPSGVLLGTVSESGTDMKFIPLSEHLYLEETLDIKDLAGEELIRTALKEKIVASGRENLYKFILKGVRGAEFSLKNLTDSLAGEAFFVKIKDETELPIATEDRGPLADKLCELIEQSDEDEEIKRLALYFAFSALDGTEVDVLETRES